MINARITLAFSCPLLAAISLAGCSHPLNTDGNGATGRKQLASTFNGPAPAVVKKPNSGEEDIGKGDFTQTNILRGAPTDPTIQSDLESRILRGSKHLDLKALVISDRPITKFDFLPFSTPAAVAKIKEIDVEFVGITDATLEGLAPLKLIELSLRGNPVRDIHALKKMISLTRLDLNKTLINSDGISVVGKLENLNVLNLSDTAVSDKDIPNLNGLKKLSLLDLRLCPKVSSQAISQLRQKLPKCIVLF